MYFLKNHIIYRYAETFSIYMHRYHGKLFHLLSLLYGMILIGKYIQTFLFWRGNMKRTIFACLLLFSIFLIICIVPNNVKGENKMGLFDKFKKKSQSSINETSSLVAAMLFESSLNGAQLFQDFNGKQMANDVFWETVLEFQFLLLHITDRIAFGAISNEKRSQFMDSLIENISQHTIDNAYNKPSSEKTPKLKEILSEYFDLLNQRNVQYANYKKLFPNEKESPSGTLFWEFGKIVSNVVSGSENIFIVESSNRFCYEVLKTINLEEIISQIK